MNLGLEHSLLWNNGKTLTIDSEKLYARYHLVVIVLSHPYSDNMSSLFRNRNKWIYYEYCNKHPIFNEQIILYINKCQSLQFLLKQIK